MAHVGQIQQKDDFISLMQILMREKKPGYPLVMDILKLNQENGKPMSKFKLAKDLKISDTAVDKWVRGENEPSLQNKNRLQDYLTFLQRVAQIRKSFGR